MILLYYSVTRKEKQPRAGQNPHALWNISDPMRQGKMTKISKTPGGKPVKTLKYVQF